MHGAAPTGLLLLLLSAGCWAEAPGASAPAVEEGPGQPTGTPAWVPSPTPQQAALLTPVQREVKAPATRVFPVLSRFGYANNRRLANPEDAVKFTRMVAKVLTDSARLYSLDTLPPGAENPVTQYGPPPGEPDGLQIVRRDAEGVGTLVPAPGADEARDLLARGAEIGDAERAAELYRAGVQRVPRVPALRVALAGALARAGHALEAEAAYREALGVDPTYAVAHLGLAELADKRGQRPVARHALVEALAYDPASPRGLGLLSRFVGGVSPVRPHASPAEGGWHDGDEGGLPPGKPAHPPTGAPGSTPVNRAPLFPLFLDVDAAGAVHAATTGSDAAQIYGGCRAVMRHEPQLRAQIFQQPRETPYSLSVAEEVICLEAALGAYLSGKGERADPPLDELLRIAREDGLSGYVMFEILGQHRPERARTAPPDVHRDTVAYLERWVLMKRGPSAEGVYTAER